MLTGDMLRRSANRFPDKPAIVWDRQTTSYAALNRQANQLANAILNLDLRKGGKVGIISRNRPEYGAAFFGLARSGCVLVNISVLYSAEELAFVLEKADVEILLVEAPFFDTVDQIRSRLTKLRGVFTIGAESGEHLLEALLASASDTEPDVEIDENEPFCMTYTGGTTGRPKGVLVSHRNRAVTAHTVMVEEAIDERDMVGVVTPMFHVAALNIMFQPAMLAGASVTMLSKWSVDDFRTMARDTGMSAAFMVPTQAAMVISDPEFDPKAYESWTKLSFAGAPMPDWVQREFLEKLPHVKLTQIYGQSEVGVLTSLRHWYLPEKLGSIGRQCYNVDVAVVDPQGIPVKPGELGEIVSRGDNVMLEYYNEPEQTAAFLRHGWGWTGDVGAVDEDGFITLIDRSKDMIISGGENVYPKEIENVLYELSEVAECAVFGIPDEKWGEVPAAYVQTHTGSTLSEQVVVDHCAARLARFKRPRLVKFVSEFPKTPIGKIQKNVLRDPYWQDKDRKI